MLQTAFNVSTLMASAASGLSTDDIIAVAKVVRRLLGDIVPPDEVALASATANKDAQADRTYLLSVSEHMKGVEDISLEDAARVAGFYSLTKLLETALSQKVPALRKVVVDKMNGTRSSVSNIQNWQMLLSVLTSGGAIGSLVSPTTTEAACGTLIVSLISLVLTFRLKGYIANLNGKTMKSWGALYSEINGTKAYGELLLIMQNAASMVEAGPVNYKEVVALYEQGKTALGAIGDLETKVNSPDDTELTGN